MLDSGDIDRARSTSKAIAEPLKLKRGELYTKIREPYFFSYVRDLLIKEYGVSTVRSGGLKVYTTIDPRFQKAAVSAIKDTLNQPGDPASALVSINPANGAIRAMNARRPGAEEPPVQPRRPGTPAGGLGLQDVRARRRRSRRDQPVHDLPLGALPLAAGPDLLGLGRPELRLGRLDLRQLLLGRTSIAAATLALGQHGLRAAHARRRAGERRRHRAPDGDQDEARAGRVDRARLELGVRPRDGVRVRDARGGRRLLRADGDPQGRPRERQGGRRGRLGQGEAQARLLGRRRVRGDADPRAERARGHRHGRVLRPPGRRQDRHDRQLRRRLVRRLHAGSRHRRLGRLPERADRDASVHGISVAGGSFPAQIWRLFMQAALRRRRDLDFPFPKNPVVWSPFQGQYALSGAEPTRRPLASTSTTQDDHHDADVHGRRLLRRRRHRLRRRPHRRRHPRRRLRRRPPAAGSGAVAARGNGGSVRARGRSPLARRGATARPRADARRSTRSACRSSAPPAACSPSPRPRASTCRRFASSAMDGYAVRSDDLPGTLDVAGEAAAGAPHAASVARRDRDRASRPAASFPTAPTRSSRSSCTEAGDGDA